MALPDSVTVDHGSVSVTTNTASEGDLRLELEAPAIAEKNSAIAEHDPAHVVEAPAPDGPVRDEQGRFAPKPKAAAPAPEPTPDPTATAVEAPAGQSRRRDDSLPRHNPIARMNQALAKAAEAERRAAALEAELSRARQPGVTGQVTPAAPGPAAGEPQFEQFADAPDPYTAYVQAWTRWDHAQQLAAARTAWTAEQQQQARAKEFQTRLDSGRTQYPDFDQVLTEADTLGLQVSAVMQEAIADSSKAADLVYFLATHPEECLQLAEETAQAPVAAAPVMRRYLESQLQGLSAPRAAPTNGSGPAARAPVSLAKPPVTPVGSSPVVSDDPPGDSASAAEHSRYWNRRLKVPGT
jgi:hypothetical protein